MARELTRKLFKVTYSTGNPVFVECENHDDLYRFVARKVLAGYIVTGISAINEDNTTPLVKVLSTSYFRKILEEEGLKKGGKTEVKVKFMFSESGTDYYRNEKNGSIYARTGSYPHNLVHWCTTYCGTPERQFRKGVEVNVVDHNGDILFTEITGDTYTEKKGQFWHEVISETADRLRAELNVLTYEDWRERLNTTCDPKVYHDNWAFASDYVETVKEERVQENIPVLSRVLYLRKTTHRHKFVPLSWESYELYDEMNAHAHEMFDPCIAIVGYRFIEEAEPPHA